jgi:hypothetical protein
VPATRAVVLLQSRAASAPQFLRFHLRVERPRFCLTDPPGFNPHGIPDGCVGFNSLYRCGYSFVSPPSLPGADADFGPPAIRQTEPSRNGLESLRSLEARQDGRRRIPSRPESGITIKSVRTVTRSKPSGARGAMSGPVRFCGGPGSASSASIGRERARLKPPSSHRATRLIVTRPWSDPSPTGPGKPCSRGIRHGVHARAQPPRRERLTRGSACHR